MHAVRASGRGYILKNVSIFQTKNHRKLESAKLIELRVFVTTNVDTKAQWHKGTNKLFLSEI